ncbi:MAG: COG3650 family protein [Sphingobium sp.]
MRIIVPVLILLLAACRAGGPGAPGDSDDNRPWSGIAPDEVLSLTGTEPFWGGNVTGGTLTYTTPDNPDGLAIRVERFAGRNGVSYSGEMDGRRFTAAVSPGQCVDGMSDRVYPFNVTLEVAGETRNGCAWSEAHPFTGPKAP